jgi:hypothetical protein
VRRGIVLIVVASPMLLAGCGGDDDAQTRDQKVRAALTGEVKDTDIRGGTVRVDTRLDSTDLDKDKAKSLCTAALEADESFREVRLYDSGGVKIFSCAS